MMNLNFRLTYKVLFVYALDPCLPYLGGKVDNRFLRMQNFPLGLTRRDLQCLILANLMKDSMSAELPTPMMASE